MHAWSEHRKLTLSQLELGRRDLGLFGKIICLDSEGQPIEFADGRNEEPEPVLDQALVRKSLTSLRRYMGKHMHGRILIGGKREGFLGDMPGVMEEGIISLEAGQPLYLAGGFGGVTADMASALDIDGSRWLPQYSSASSHDPRLTAGMSLLRKFRKDKWKGLNNGLSDPENRQLATTHRPSEIAALVSLGLGRLFRNDRA
jgi:hypothetical protein